MRVIALLTTVDMKAVTTFSVSRNVSESGSLAETNSVPQTGLTGFAEKRHFEPLLLINPSPPPTNAPARSIGENSDHALASASVGGFVQILIEFIDQRSKREIPDYNNLTRLDCMLRFQSAN